MLNFFSSPSVPNAFILTVKSDFISRASHVRSVKFLSFILGVRSRGVCKDGFYEHA